MNSQVIPGILPSDVAKYFLARAVEDGDLISPLKMQKLVYYAYVWTLVKKRKKLFDEHIEAWPSGPVVPSLYRELKKFGASSIEAAYLGIKNESELGNIYGKFPKDVLSVLSEVYEDYISKSAFELVGMTHAERPWREARDGLDATEKSHAPIKDELIMAEYAIA